ncbi:MAG: TrmH family RNA methyltransferase [Bacteroidota bacterium]
MMRITSPANPKVKLVVQLQKQASERRKHQLFVTEGKRETNRAIAHGYKPRMLFVCEEIAGHFPHADIPEVYEVSKPVYEKMAYRPGTEGVLGVFDTFYRPLASLELPANPLVIVLEGLEKPGNLGAIFRTADGCGAHALIVCNPNTDMFNPNVLRSGLGCFFSVPWATCTSEACMQWLHEKSIRIFCARVEGSMSYTEVDFKGPAALVLGAEDVGLSHAWNGAHAQAVHIPMLGSADSLNVSVSAAVILYEALRQRNTIPA